MKPKEMVQILKHNGFQVIRQKGSHIIMYNEKQIYGPRSQCIKQN